VGRRRAVAILLAFPALLFDLAGCRFGCRDGVVAGAFTGAVLDRFTAY